MKRAETKRKKYKMSETETLEQEVETVEPNAVEELINQITAGDLNKAEGSFKSILDDKMADALEAQRVAVGGQMFNRDEEEVSDEDIVDEYIEDEEDETLELGAEDETGLDADIETSTEEDEIETEEEITDEEEAAVEEVFEEDEEILAELED
jgi:hypothetical protein